MKHRLNVPNKSIEDQGNYMPMHLCDLEVRCIPMIGLLLTFSGGCWNQPRSLPLNLWWHRWLCRKQTALGNRIACRLMPSLRAVFSNQTWDETLPNTDHKPCQNRCDSSSDTTTREEMPDLRHRKGKCAWNHDPEIWDCMILEFDLRQVRSLLFALSHRIAFRPSFRSYASSG
jgi:hypothetical protein